MSSRSAHETALRSCQTPAMARTEDTVRRIFVAVDIDDEVRYGLAARISAALADSKLPGRAPPPANWHITLRFLGKVDQPAYETVLAKLDEADLGAPFRLSFTRLGAFPRAARATVLWLGVGAGTDELVDLAAQVEGAVVDAGCIPEERPFHPHLTLSRIRPPGDVRQLMDLVADFPLIQPVDRVTVFESHLGGGPAIYETLETFTLS